MFLGRSGISTYVMNLRLLMFSWVFVLYNTKMMRETFVLENDLRININICSVWGGWFPRADKTSIRR